MKKRYDVIAYGLDYVRYKIFSDKDFNHIGAQLPYLELTERFFHGYRFIDLTGKQLEIIRRFEDIDNVVTLLALTFPVTRIDVFVDVVGYVLSDVTTNGTLIFNYSRLETMYSDNLRNRGNLGVFCRAYDAQAAGHYDILATRFECEYKREHAKVILGTNGWNIDPVEAMLYSIKTSLGVDIRIPGKVGVDFNAPTRRYEHSRERFYRRYGKNILLDIERMGAQGLYGYVMECVNEGAKTRDKDSNS